MMAGVSDGLEVRSAPKLINFPVFSLVIREFGRRDWFAADCSIRQRVLLWLDIAPKAAKCAPVRRLSLVSWQRRMLPARFRINPDGIFSVASRAEFIRSAPLCWVE